MTPRGTPELCYAHIVQLMTHSAMYKPLGILQRVTKSQKVHISSDDGFSNFITSTLLKIGLRVSHSSRNKVSLTLWPLFMDGVQLSQG